MVGFSHRPEKALGEELSFEVDSSEVTLKEYQERRKSLYTCEYIGLDEFIHQHGWNHCSDQLLAFRHSLHFGYTYDFSDKVFEQAKHELELEVEDNVGNKSIYKTIFFRKYNLN